MSNDTSSTNNLKVSNDTSSTNNLKVPPHNAEAERAVLGSILLDATTRSEDRVLDECPIRGIVPDSFYDPKNRFIYETMLKMSRESKPVDAVSLIGELEAVKRLEAVGGMDYIQSLMDMVPTTAHAEHYMNIVLDKYRRRQMIERASKVIDECLDEREYPDPQVVLGNAEKSFLEIGDVGSSSASWGTVIRERSKRLGAKIRGDGATFDGLSTGYKCLDDVLCGMKPGQMIVIAARPSKGKTSLAMNIAESCARGEMITDGSKTPDGGVRHPVAIFSQEMPTEQLADRMLSGRGEINMWQVNRHLLSSLGKDTYEANLTAAAESLSRLPFYVDDSSALDIMDLRSRARRMKKRNGVELIVIDYLQLSQYHEFEQQGGYATISKISSQIKAMAKELKVPVIVISQLSRKPEERNDKTEAPQLSDLRDSGAIEQDADVVMLLRVPSLTKADPELNDKTLAYVNIAKNRNGETREVAINFNREYTRFTEREPEQTNTNAK